VRVTLNWNLSWLCNQPFSYWGDALIPHDGNEVITAEKKIFRAWGLQSKTSLNTSWDSFSELRMYISLCPKWCHTACLS